MPWHVCIANGESCGATRKAAGGRVRESVTSISEEARKLPIESSGDIFLAGRGRASACCDEMALFGHFVEVERSGTVLVTLLRCIANCTAYPIQASLEGVGLKGLAWRFLTERALKEY